GVITFTRLGNFHCKNKPINNGTKTIQIIFINNAIKSTGTTLPTDACTKDGVNTCEIIVSKVAIIILTATSPPAINVKMFADVQLGTVPDKIIQEATYQL